MSELNNKSDLRENVSFGVNRRNYNYHVEEEKEISTPALIFYRNLIEDNIERMIKVAGNAKRLWPHVKTHKNAHVVRMQMEKGITRFKCATIAEAEMVAQEGAEAALLAYPQMGPNIQRLISFVTRFKNTRLYTIGDNLEPLKELSQAAIAGNLRFPVLIDIDVGMHRTGVSPEDALELYLKASALEGLEICGIHAYDGHLDIEDPEVRREKAGRVYDLVKQLQDEIRSKEVCCDMLVMGGSPTFPIYAEYPDTLLSPGTIVIGDAGYRNRFSDLDFMPGAAILARVVSHQKEGSFTIDLGYKGIASDHDKKNRGIIIGIDAEPLFQSEEHWVWKMREGSVPPIGSMVYVVPIHICPTSALYPAVLVAEGGKVVDEWEVTARNRKLTV